MIKFLRIRNLATIEDIRLDLDAGFSVLTGETGAGKSIIIDSIRLVCGEKASSDLVRTGRRRGFGRGDLRPARDARPGRGHSLAEDDGATSRSSARISEDGTGKAYFDGVLVPGQEAQGGRRRAGGHLRPERSYLPPPARKPSRLPRPVSPKRPACGPKTAAAAQDAAPAGPPEGGMDGEGARAGQRLDFLRFQIAEIEKAGFRPGEEEELRGPAAHPQERGEDLGARRSGARSGLYRRGLATGAPGQARACPGRARGVRPRLRRDGRVARAAGHHRRGDRRRPGSNTRTAGTWPPSSSRRSRSGSASSKAEAQIRRPRSRTSRSVSSRSQAGSRGPRPDPGEARPTSRKRSARRSRPTRPEAGRSPGAGRRRPGRSEKTIEEEIGLLGHEEGPLPGPGRIRAGRVGRARAGQGHAASTRSNSSSARTRASSSSPCARSPRAASCPGSCSP